MSRHNRALKCGLAAISLTLMAACGGGGSSPPNGPAVQVSSDPQLTNLWKQAQQVLATQNIEINAAAVVVDHVPPDMFPPDPRALDVSSSGVTVTPVPDLTVAQLHQENPGVTLQHNTDPTGVVHCAGNAEGARYCVSYTEGNSVYVAASQEYNPGATGWEFSNIILAKLGYNIANR